MVSTDNKPILKLVPLAAQKQSRKPGSGKGLVLYMAPDFDRTPEDFGEYV
ncbi:MAG: hypothetical protein HYU77_04710 [Betaproteobacteria bacterium]|nr:hypothetical protein [Betaproteobacteria bacterium]